MVFKDNMRKSSCFKALWNEDKYIAIMVTVTSFIVLFLLTVLVCVLYVDVVINFPYSGAYSQAEATELRGAISGAVIVDIIKKDGDTFIYLKDGRYLRVDSYKGHSVYLEGEYKKVENQ